MKNIIKKKLQKAVKNYKRLRPVWQVIFALVLCIGIGAATVKVVGPIRVVTEAPEEPYSYVEDYSSIHDVAKQNIDEEERSKESKILEDISQLENQKRVDEIARFHDYHDDSHNTDNTDSSAEVTTADSVQRWTETEIDVLVLAVQHEVGTNPGYYPNCDDFDKLQRAMCRVIYNRIGAPGFGNTLQEVLLQKNQFTGLLEDISHYWEIPNSEQYNPKDERTRANVMAVLNGEDGLSSDIYFERCSLRGQSSIYEAWEYVTSLYASPTIALEYYEETADGRFIMFISNPNGAY